MIRQQTSVLLNEGHSFIDAWFGITGPICLTVGIRLALIHVSVCWVSAGKTAHLSQDEPHPEEVHHGGDCQGHEHSNHDNDPPPDTLLLQHLKQFWVTVAKQDDHLEHKPSKQERKEDEDGIDGVAGCAMLSMGVQDPAKANVGS